MKRKAPPDENLGSKRPKEDFFKAPQVDKDLDERFHRELIKHIASTCTSFNQYGESFQRVISILNKRVKVKHPRTLSRMIDTSAEELMADLTAIIKTVKNDLVSLGFTTDLWTSRALDSYISLTVSFIDRFTIIMISWFNLFHFHFLTPKGALCIAFHHFVIRYWMLHRWTPFVRHFPERHLGSNIALKLDRMLEQLELTDPDLIKFCVNDNAANMIKGIRESEYLEEYLCDNHTLQLVIKDTFDQVEGMKRLLRKCKDLAKMTHQSTSVANQQLKDRCKQMGIKFAKLKNPCETRWNSYYDCGISVLRLKNVLQVIHP